MKYFYVVVFSMLFACSQESSETELGLEETVDSIPAKDLDEQKVAIVIHGGAGAIKKENMSDSLEMVYMRFLDSTIVYGHQLLMNGTPGEEVVVSIIELMENSPLFNAGKGAVFTNEGKNELDASLMHGGSLNAGAIAGVKTIKNPIKLARAVMNNSEHVFLTGDGAEAFAVTQGIETVSPSYFYVKSRFDALQRIQQKEQDKDAKFGTVGCVVLDQNGDIVAGTSTGGMTNKKWGRVGDSPIIGAGTYANNATCGVSSTGWGEFFIRNIVAYDVSALMEYANMPLHEATAKVIQEKLRVIGGDGGIIALDTNGNISFEFNTDGMYRAGIDGKAKKTVAIYE